MNTHTPTYAPSEPRMVLNNTLWDGSTYSGWVKDKHGIALPHGEAGNREYTISNHPHIGGEMQVQERGKYTDGNLSFGTRNFVSVDMSAYGLFHREGHLLDGYRVIGGEYTIVKSGSDHRGLTEMVREYRKNLNGFKIARSIITEKFSKEEGESITRTLGEGLGLIFFAVIEQDFVTARRLKREMIAKLQSIRILSLNRSVRYELETRGYFLDEEVDRFIDRYESLVGDLSESLGGNISQMVEMVHERAISSLPISN